MQLVRVYIILGFDHAASMDVSFDVFRNVFSGGAVVCGLFYMLGDAMRPAPLPKPQGSPSQQPPPAPSSSPSLNEVESLNTLEDQDTGEWVFSEPPPSEELLETENYTWDSK